MKWTVFSSPVLGALIVSSVVFAELPTRPKFDKDGIPACPYPQLPPGTWSKIPKVSTATPSLNSPTSEPRRASCSCDLKDRECTEPATVCVDPPKATKITRCRRADGVPVGRISRAEVGKLKCVLKEEETLPICNEPDCHARPEREDENCVVCREQETMDPNIVGVTRRRTVRWLDAYDCGSTKFGMKKVPDCTVKKIPGKDGFAVDDNCSEEPDQSGACGGACSGVPLIAANKCQPANGSIKPGTCAPLHRVTPNFSDPKNGADRPNRSNGPRDETNGPNEHAAP